MGKIELEALLKIMKRQKKQQEQLDEIQEALQLIVEIMTKQLEEK